MNFPVLFCIGLWPCCVCIWVMQTIAGQLSNECSTSKRGKTINGIIDRIEIMFSQWLFYPLVRCRRSWNGNNASDSHELCIYKVNKHDQFILHSIYVQFFPPLFEVKCRIRTLKFRNTACAAEEISFCTAFDKVWFVRRSRVAALSLRCFHRK